MILLETFIPIISQSHSRLADSHNPHSLSLRWRNEAVVWSAQCRIFKLDWKRNKSIILILILTERK